MGEILALATTAIIGSPPNPAKQPTGSLLVQAFQLIDSAVTAFISNGGLIYDTLAHLNADLTPGNNASAWVISDTTVANNGIYRKAGATTTGSWSRVADLPYSFIAASNGGGGTATAIAATTAIPLPSADGMAMISLPIYVANTGPTTVSFNGGTPLAIVSASGAPVKGGDLRAASVVWGTVASGQFQLTQDFGMQFMFATSTGTANAIAATTPSTAVTLDGGALVMLPIPVTNTSSTVTVSFNGGPLLTVKTALGNPPAIGAMTAGAYVLGTKIGSTFQLLTELNNAADAAAAEAAAAVATAAAASFNLAIYVYTTATAASAATIPSGVQMIEVMGFAAFGDGWHRVLKKVGSQPTHPAKLQSADGAWWESTAPRKALNMQGQSNAQSVYTFSWSPVPNFFFWNWDGVDGHVGTAFARHAGTQIGTGPAWANEYARQHPSEDVFLVNVAFGGMTIDHWTGGIKNYAYSTLTDNTGMISASGSFRFNNANPALATKVFVHQADTTYPTTGQTHLGGLQDAFAATTTRVYKASDPTVYVQFTFGSPVTVSNWYEVPITSVTSAGTLVNGDAVVIKSAPDIYANNSANTTAALAQIGATKFDALGFRQSESDAVEPYDWPAEVELFIGHMVSDGYIDVTTPIVFWGQTDTALSTIVPYGDMAYYIQRAVAGNPSSRFYIDTAGALSDPSLWVSAGGITNIHMTGQGYLEAGALGANRMAGRGGVYPALKGIVTQPENETVALTEDGTVSAPALIWLADRNTGIYRPANDQIAVAVGGVQGLLIDSTKLTIPGQIVFPATQAPSANANTLDDYEEGTALPTLLFGGGNTGMTGTFSLQYVKIGTLVSFWITISLTAKGSSSGAATIGNLPFTSIGGNNQAIGALLMQGMATNWGDTNVGGLISQASTTLTPYKGLTTALGGFSDTDFTNASTIYISGAYRAAA